MATQGGHVYGSYTGRTFASARETDIEHIVSLSEAHDSGLCAADAATRRRFASDPLNLTLDLCLVAEAGMAAPHFFRRPANRSSE